MGLSSRSKYNEFEQARNSLISFVSLFEPSYMTNWHIFEICHALEEVMRGNIDRLILQAPPRHSKSLHVSHYFPAWYMGHHANHEIMQITYAQSFADKWGGKVKGVITDPRYQKIFPGVFLNPAEKSKREFSTNKKGEYHALGIDGQATGKGCDLGIVDDPFKNRKEAESELQRDNVMEFFDSALYTRLSPIGRLVVMMTRWHEDDMIGRLLNDPKYADEDFTVLCFPATDEAEKIPLWEERYNLKKLMAIKKVQGPYNWNSLFLQRPSAKEGNLVKRKWFRYWNVLPEKFDKVIQSWDLAFKEKKDTDYVVGQVWGKKGYDLFLIDQFRQRVDFIKTIRAILRMTEQYPNARMKYIEDKANGPATVSVLKNKVFGITEVDPGAKSKLERLESTKDNIEAGYVYLPSPRIKPWVEDYINEFLVFPNGKNDDQIDASTQAWRVLNPLVDPARKYLALLS